MILKLYSSLTYCAVGGAADIASFPFFFWAAATYDWLLLSLWSFYIAFFCLSLNVYDIQLQSRRIEAEKTETALWHWSLNLQAKVMPDHAPLINDNAGFLQLHNFIQFVLYVFRCFACGGSGLQSVRENRSVWLRQLSFTEMNCWERVSHTSSCTQHTWMHSQLTLPSTAMNRCICAFQSSL